MNKLLSAAVSISFFAALLLALSTFLVVNTHISRSNQHFHDMEDQTKDYLANYQSNINFIFNTLFDQAQICQNQPDCKTQISQTLINALPNHSQLRDFSSTYFIRINQQGQIEKLFLSGDFQQKTPDNNAEKQVIRLLKGQINQLSGFRINHLYSTMKYLHDFYSEAEIIIPIRTDDRVMGAIVRLYGEA